jgi:Fe-S-cluster-containing hydrogenase component 2
MMQVDLEKCTGCGTCLEACATGAISMVEGKAAIDFDNCLSCGACTDACPQGAISEASLPVAVAAPTVVLQQKAMPAAVPVVVTRPAGRFSWAMPAISFIGKEILPRAVDALIAALDRRLTATTTAQVASAPRTASQRNGGRRQVRQRRRGNKF